MAKPTSKPDWVNDDNPAKITEPLASKKLSGFLKEEKPPFQMFNWVFNIVSKWIDYFDTVINRKGADIASAATLTLGTDGSYFDVTGTTTITAIATMEVGFVVKLHFDAVLTITHHATNLVLHGMDITTYAGMELEFAEYATGDWKLTGGENANTVDGIHASSSAEANKLLALDGSSKLPASITGDADTVDGIHASSSATANQLLALNGSSKLPTDITGDADTVDGIHASSSPSANQLLSLNGSSQFPHSVTKQLCFKVHKNGTNQTILDATYTNITWSTEDFDSNNDFSSDKHTPSVAGYYFYTVQIRIQTVDGKIITLILEKNGATFVNSTFQSSTSTGSAETFTICGLVYMNGTTNNVSVQIVQYCGASKDITGTEEYTFFQGFRLG